jgi:hypothetical protein
VASGAWRRTPGFAQGLIRLFCCGVLALGSASGQVQGSPSRTRAEQEFGLMEPVRLAPPRLTTFAGYEASLSTSYFSAGVKFAPDSDLYHSGPVVLIAGGAGISPSGGFRLDSASAALNQQAKLLAGYRFVDAATSLTLMVGQAMEYRQQVWLSGHISPGAPRFGPAFLAELWSQPDKKTLVSAAFAYTGSDDFSWLRLHLGRRLYGYTYAGPELAVSTDGLYSQLRAGLRLTGLSVGTVAFDVSTGMAHDSAGRAGAYVTLSVYSSL